MNDQEYYARLRREMEKRKAKTEPGKPVKKTTRRKPAKVFAGESMSKPATDNIPITNDDILNIRIAAETSEDVLDFIRRI